MKLTRRSFLITAALTPGVVLAQRRRRVVVKRTRVVVHPGHPILRAANRNVIVRTPGKTVVVGARPVFLPVIVFAAAAAAIALPARDRLLWQDSETIHRDEEWVESNFGVDERGEALYLDINGRADLDFAEVAFENGEVQVVDFNERTYGNGVHRLLDFPGRRNVKTVRLLARSKSSQTIFKIYLSK